VLTNSSIQVLLKQGTAEVDLVSKTFYLSEGERELLLSSDIGQGLFFAGQNHVAMEVVSAPFENEIITSNPAELLAKQDLLTQQSQEQAVLQQPPIVALPPQPEPVQAPILQPASDPTSSTS
jgi:hypothetical protein